MSPFHLGFFPRSAREPTQIGVSQGTFGSIYTPASVAADAGEAIRKTIETLKVT